MKLWTFQRPGAWARAQECGTLRGDGRRIEQLFRPAYRWLRERMKERIPGCAGRFPVWAWVEKPDLRRSEHRLRPGERSVILECEVPEGRVLFSEFMAWHHVLNGWFLALSEAEDERWERKWGRSRHEALPPRARLRVEESWERIFDVRALARSPLWRGTQVVQAVVEEVRLEEIVGAREVAAR